MVYVTNLKKVHEKIITHIEKKEKQCYYKYIIILSSESQTTYGLKREISHNTAENSANIRQYYS